MARTEQIKCDVCGKIKGEANHWLELLIDTKHNGFTLKTDYIIVNYQVPPSDIVYKDFCGQDCLIREIQSIVNAGQGK